MPLTKETNIQPYNLEINLVDALIKFVNDAPGLLLVSDLPTCNKFCQWPWPTSKRYRPLPSHLQPVTLLTDIVLLSLLDSLYKIWPFNINQWKCSTITILVFNTFLHLYLVWLNLSKFSRLTQVDCVEK